MKFKLLAIFLLLGAASAQENLAIAGHVPDAPSTHKFWNTENKIDFSIFAGQLAADAITTQKGLNEGFREMNPLMRPRKLSGRDENRRSRLVRQKSPGVRSLLSLAQLLTSSIIGE
jgi:hypothetical protein